MRGKIYIKTSEGVECVQKLADLREIAAASTPVIRGGAYRGGGAYRSRGAYRGRGSRQPWSHRILHHTPRRQQNTADSGPQQRGSGPLLSTRGDSVDGEGMSLGPDGADEEDCV
ncbi:hypothetical protein BaRGS_00035276 [Batillaria attramentaria]|uniref:Uncharacterized protein n=1 Tax=Batillaria attramentaria TaxID=370345 RepID=A0ABD0JFE9_9CAEN